MLQERDLLAQHGIRVVTTRLSQLEGDERGTLTGVVLEDGERIPLRCAHQPVQLAARGIRAVWSLQAGGGKDGLLLFVGRLQPFCWLRAPAWCTLACRRQVRVVLLANCSPPASRPARRYLCFNTGRCQNSDLPTRMGLKTDDRGDLVCEAKGNVESVHGLFVAGQPPPSLHPGFCRREAAGVHGPVRAPGAVRARALSPQLSPARPTHPGCPGPRRQLRHGPPEAGHHRCQPGGCRGGQDQQRADV